MAVKCTCLLLQAHPVQAGPEAGLASERAHPDQAGHHLHPLAVHQDPQAAGPHVNCDQFLKQIFQTEKIKFGEIPQKLMI